MGRTQRKGAQGSQDLWLTLEPGYLEGGTTRVDNSNAQIQNLFAVLCVYGNGYAGLSLLFSDWSSCPGAGLAAARVCASQKRIYATRLHFFFHYRDVCAFLRRIDRCAVRLHRRRFWLFSWPSGR